MKKNILSAVLFVISVSICACGTRATEYEKREAGSEIAETADVAANPYFPYSEDTLIENSSSEELVIMGKADWQIHFVSANESGKLYQLECNRIYDRIGSAEIFDVEEVRNTNVSYYFWVMEDSIYCIDEITEEENSALIEDNIIPKKAALICREEELEDSLSEDEVGRHELIESHEENIKCYRSFSIVNDVDPEGRDCLQFIWKKDIGLIGYRYSRTAAGGDSIRIWNPEYLEIKGVGFDIDGF